MRLQWSRSGRRWCIRHHDDSYQWAERRKIEAHPKTGAAQIVEIRETVQEIVIPKYVEIEQPAPPKPLLFVDVADDGDLEEVYNTERHLLYVACTRARDHLLVTGVEPASEFLDDLRTAL